MMLSTLRQPLFSLPLLLFLSTTLAAPSPQGGGAGDEGGPPPVEPTVDSMRLIGDGCPLGSGGIVREVRDGTPVFLFTEWTLDLADAPVAENASATSSHTSKFCSEQIALGNGPAGWKVRIAVVNVGGVASLGDGTRLGVGVETRLGDVVGGASSGSIGPADLKDGGTWSVSLPTAPQIWSPCVGQDGKVPPITIQTTISLNGTVSADGRASKGTVGGPKTDLKKALSLHFNSRWRKCT